MVFDTVQSIVGTAIVDSGFRRILVERTEDALDRFHLTPEEAAAISSIRADSFQGFARELHNLLERSLQAELAAGG